MPPQRILYVVNEAHFFLSHREPIARAMRERGFEVHVAAPGDHVWAPDGFAVADLEAHGFRFHEIPLNRRGLNPLEDARTFLALCGLYRRLRPALVHHLTIKPVLYGGIAARLTGVPAMVSAITGRGHVFSGRGPLVAALRAAALVGYRIATRHRNCRIVVQNPEDAEALVSAGAAPADRMTLIRGAGVAADRFVATPECQDGPPVVVLPARLIWEKGIGELVAAARLLQAECVPARFALIGKTHPSNPRAVPQVLLEQWHAEGLVEWWGRREDMPEVFRQVHVVCLPSTYGEGIPKVLIEAAAAGRPVVTTDIPGCRDIVRDGANGLLVPPGDVPALAAALRRLLTDPDLRRRMGSAGRAVFEADFTEEQVVARTLEIYDALLAAAPRRAA